MATRRASQLTIAYHPTWQQQSDWDVPIDGAELTRAFPATSRNYLDIDETIEDVFNCTGEDFLFEILTGTFARLNIDMDVDPDVLAGIMAFAYGSAASPSAGTDEVQTETISATGGTRTLTVQIGANAQTTTDINFNAAAADIQAALEALSNVAPADIVVASVGNVNEVQTETVTATGGTRTLTVINPVTGVSGTTAAIAYNANAAAIQAALELLANVDAGDIVVSGAGPYVYTFSGPNYRNANVATIVPGTALLTGGSTSFANTTPGATGTRTYTFSGVGFEAQDVALIAPNGYFLTGGTSSFATTTGGLGSLHAISRLTGYTLPLMTFYIGFRGSDKQPVIFKNVVVNSVRIRSASREKVTASIELIGSADLQDAVAFTMPECTDILPLRFADCQMSVGGVDFNANDLAREFEYYFQNDVSPRFDGSAVYSTRHERADQRPSGFNMWVLGEPGDAIYTLAKNKTTLDTFIRIGPAGRNVKCRAPQGFVKLAPSPIRFGGDPAESEIALVIRPKKVSGDATTPTTVTANIAQSIVLLDVDVP